MSTYASNQQAIWSHFQGDRIAAFDGAYWRLEQLLHYAAKRHQIPAVVNIGIGNGYLELLAQKRGWRVTGIDPDEGAVSRLRVARIDARCGVIEQLPVNSDFADVVFASEVFEHLKPEGLSAGLSEIRRVLKAGGHLIGTVPFNERLVENECVCPNCTHVFHRWGHEQAFTPETMRALLSGFLEVEVCRPKYFPAWKMLNLIGKVDGVLRVAVLNPIGVHRRNENILFIARKGR